MDYKRIKQLMKDFENSNIHSFEYEDETFSIKLEKENKTYVSEALVPSVRPHNEHINDIEETHEHKKESGCEIKAPLVGTFYSSPSPEDKPFVKVGDFVKGGQTVCIIEAMKVMNEIKAPHDGVIKDVLVDNEEMVEFDQTIIVLD